MMRKKSIDVEILSITASKTRVFGLGSDGKVYVWGKIKTLFALPIPWWFLYE
jgi:hypothetical protein